MSGPVSVLILPPHDLWEPWTGTPPDTVEDQELTYRILSRRGFTHKRIDILGWPLNPFGRAHPLLRSIDPLRALRILLFYRRARIVLCHFEASALAILLLRRIFFFRGKVAILDVGLDTGWPLRRRILDIVVPRADALLPLGSNRRLQIERRWKLSGFVQPILASLDCAYYAKAADQPGGAVVAIGDDGSRDYSTLLAAARLLPYAIKIRTRLLDNVPSLPSNVSVLRTFLSPLAYRDLIAEASIIVLPLYSSDHAGGVTVLIQAMASGKALIVSDSVGIGDYIIDGQNCIVVPPGDPVRLAHEIGRLLADTALRETIGANARTFAEQHLSREVAANELESVFRRLVPDA